MTREMGKVLAETRGDVQEAIDMTYYMAGEGRRLFGQTTPSELPNKFAMSVRQSIGVGGSDHAVEFSDGDSVVEDDAGAGERKHCCDRSRRRIRRSLRITWCRRLRTRVCRAGVVNFVSGDGPNAGAPLASHTDAPVVQLHGFDGSREN